MPTKEESWLSPVCPTQTHRLFGDSDLGISSSLLMSRAASADMPRVEQSLELWNFLIDV